MNKTSLFNKRTLLLLAGFVLIIIIISITYLFFINDKKDYSYLNPGGTGGDYIPKNIVVIKGGGIFYKYLIDSDADKTLYMIEQAVLYNTSISNNSKFSNEYRNLKMIESGELSYYRNGESYSVTIDDNEINFDEKTPRDYWLNLTTSDGRHFRLESTGSLVENKSGALILIKLIED